MIKKLLLIILSFSFGSIGMQVIASEVREPYKKNKDFTFSNLYLNKKCVRLEKREKYIPGNYFSPGYVKYWKEHIEIDCPNEIEVRNCFVLKYNEEYIPGDNDYPGYVKSWNEEISIPCGKETSDNIPKRLIKKSKRGGN